MKRKLLSIALIAPLSLILSCGGEEDSSETNETTEEVVENEPVIATEEIEVLAKNVEAEEFKSLIESGEGVLLDVRTPGEFEGGHIENATNIDFNGADFETQIEELDKTVPYYVYCHGGGRSGQAMEMMADKGFSKVYNLVGGYGNWPYK